ncbi:MAG TPA: glycosyltransferase family 2 protein [bacterium]|nr:glycosyltransferase family 2 protein [bacterium]
MKVSVFIPFCNEQGNLEELIARVEEGVAKAGVEGELVMVDDGSRDGGAAIVERIARDKPWVRLFRHRTNFGLTQAMKTGFAACTGDIIVFLPSDLESYPDEDIPKLLAGFTDGVEVVCGRRVGRRETKIFLSKIYNEISQALFGMGLHDMNWIKAFRRECLPDLELRSDWHRFIAQILYAKGWRVIEVPVNWYPRKSGRSHFGFTRIPISFFDALAVKFILTFTKAPMRLFGSFGGLQMLASVVIVSWMLYITFALDDNAFRNRPLLLFTILMFLSGTIFLFMGFIAELVVSLKDEITKRK